MQNTACRTQIVDLEHLLRCAESGEECSFDLNGRRRILYGWGQCDGVFLNIADENGEILWQAVGRSRAECAEKLRSAFLQDAFFTES